MRSIHWVANFVAMFGNPFQCTLSHSPEDSESFLAEIDSLGYLAGILEQVKNRIFLNLTNLKFL